jgi:CheY-like chemotaxis protein
MGDLGVKLDAASARPLEILLVEDNPGDVRLVVEALRQGKLLHRLSVADNGAKALAMLRRDGTHIHRRSPDLILLDLNLPGLSGQELLGVLKSDPRMARIPIVVMTSSDAHEDVARAYASHANCYIRKPVGIDQLLSIVHGIGHFWLSVVSLPEPATRDRPDAWRLLLVEDNPGDARLVRELLSGSDIEIVHVERLADALIELKRAPFTLGLVDPGLPGPESYRALTARLTQAGYPLARVHTVIVTHSHPDHFGGAGRLRDETGAAVVGHRSFSTWWDPAEPADVDLDTIASSFSRSTPWDEQGYGDEWRAQSGMTDLQELRALMHALGLSAYSGETLLAAQ